MAIRQVDSTDEAMRLAIEAEAEGRPPRYCVMCRYRKFASDGEIDGRICNECQERILSTPVDGFSARCTACGVIRRLDDFSPDKRKRNGRASQCKRCRSAANATGQSRPRPKRDNRAKEKECARCGERLRIAEFNAKTTAADGLQSYCRTCQSAARNVSSRSN